MKHLLPVALLLFLMSCQPEATKTTDKTEQVELDSTANQPLYPYVQFIKEQIADVDSTPYAVIKVAYENGKQIDSGLIEKKEFINLAQSFVQYDVNDAALRKFYQEESFQDLTLNVVTFSISAKQPNLPLQQADVLLNPETQKIKIIILKKIKQSGDSSITENLLWVNNQNFQISRTIETPSGNLTQATKIIWNAPLQ